MAVTLRVYQNGDDVFLTWRIPERIPDCRGFAIIRERNGRPPKPLPSFAGFETETWERGDSRPSTEWPIQKFWWTDYTTRAGDSVRYRVVPMVRNGDKLEERESLGSRWSARLAIDHRITRHVACYFNRGIVASQFVQRLLGEELTVGQRRSKLDTVINDLEKPTARNILAGDLRIGVGDLLRMAADKRLSVRAALFELTDEELTAALVALGDRLEIVLADGAPTHDEVVVADNDLPTGEGTAEDENATARKALRAGGAVVHDRMSSKKFLAHNKIVVVSDTDGSPRWTWTGSMNWTSTGLCTQANNGLLVDDAKVAARFSDQIKLLGAAGNESPASLHESNSTSFNKAVDGARIVTWFTATNQQVDLKDARQRIADAKEGVLFLMFQTGLTDSLLRSILDRRTDPDFFVHGVISTRPGKAQPGDPPTAMGKDLAFVHKNQRRRYAPDLLLPFALTEPSERWLQEFVKKNRAHAIVHSKVVVLDPFGENPVVMTGSHNMGTTASKKNDENLVIISGNRAIAAAYVVNIMAIYDNFRWRFRVAEGTKWKGSQDHDRWQDRYLAGRVPEFQFFSTD